MRWSTLIVWAGASVAGPSCNVAFADYFSSSAWFDSLSFTQQVGLQGELMLNGKYEGLIDGAFGPSTYQAVLDYQNDPSADGVLSATESSALLRAAAGRYSQLGFKTGLDIASKTTLPIPYGVVGSPTSVQWGTDWRSPDGSVDVEALEVPSNQATLATLFAQFTSGPSRNVAYSYFPGGWFAANGTYAGRNFYVAFKDGGAGTSRGFSLTWSFASPVGNIIADYLASALIEPQALIADSYLASAAASPSSTQLAALPKPSTPFATTPAAPTIVLKPPISQPQLPSQPASVTPGSGAEIASQQIMLGGVPVEVITVEGELQLGDEKRFANEAIKFDRAIVALDSPGGNLLAGLQIGEDVHLKGFSTLVLPGSTCASACALAWLAGSTRFMAGDARIGFHAASDGADPNQSVSGVGNALIGSYLNQLGLPVTAVAYITESRPSEITFLTGADANRVGIAVQILPGPTGAATASAGTP